MDPPQMLTELYPYTTDINPLISLGGIVSINELTLILEEEFEDNKGVIRIRISNKNKQHNGQKEKYKRTKNDLQNIYRKLNIE
jgi:hypothetical protein